MKTYQKVIIALVICGFGVAAIQWMRKGKPISLIEAKEPMPVEAIIAKSGSILRRVTAAGNLSAIQWVSLHPQVNGKIIKIYFKDGELVKEGEPLFKIDDAVYKVKVREIEANFALARAEYERSSTLLEKKYMSASERDKRLAQLQVLEANLDEAKISLENTTIKAPFEGVMGLSKVSVGTLVSSETELANIVDLDPINIDFSIPESYLSSVHVGDEVDVTIEDFDILPVEATIKAISPEINEDTRTIKMRAEMPNTELNYRPGEYARVLIEAGKVQNAVIIPETALEREGDEDFVMLVVDNVAIRSTVSTGMRDGNQVEITHGVKAGDVVISAGQFRIHDGEEVSIVNEDQLKQSKEK